jgi:hypothetical protein
MLMAQERRDLVITADAQALVNPACSKGSTNALAAVL